MIVCPGCQHENLDGSVFCSDCGAQLAGAEDFVTQNIDTSDKIKLTQTERTTATDLVELDTWASLHLLASGQILPLADRTEFTLGRVSDAQPIMPDIDLTPYQAYSSGVSRLHAVFKREGQQVFVKDLGSSNGTYLNGKRLKSNVDQPLTHGDLLSLGKLKIQILLKIP